MMGIEAIRVRHPMEHKGTVKTVLRALRPVWDKIHVNKVKTVAVLTFQTGAQMVEICFSGQEWGEGRV